MTPVDGDEKRGDATGLQEPYRALDQRRWNEGPGQVRRIVRSFNDWMMLCTKTACSRICQSQSPRRTDGNLGVSRCIRAPTW